MFIPISSSNERANLLYPKKRIIISIVKRLEVLQDKLFAKHSFVKWHAESSVNEFSMVKRLKHGKRRSNYAMFTKYIKK